MKKKTMCFLPLGSRFLILLVEIFTCSHTLHSGWMSVMVDFMKILVLNGLHFLYFIVLLVGYFVVIGSLYSLLSYAALNGIKNKRSQK